MVSGRASARPGAPPLPPGSTKPAASDMPRSSASGHSTTVPFALALTTPTSPPAAHARPERCACARAPALALQAEQP